MERDASEAEGKYILVTEVYARPEPESELMNVTW
jgi:hypothetical protein